MRWKPVRFVPDGTRLPFMRWSRYGFFLSGLLCLLSIYLFAANGLNYGVDFKGGTVMNIRSAQAISVDDLRSTLGALDLGEVEVQQAGTANDAIIRIEAQQGGDAAERQAVEKVKQTLGQGIEYRSVEFIGPKVSALLTQEAILAVVVSILGVLIYLWFRFEWQFAVGGVISLLHDTLLTIGLFSLLGLEFNLTIIAAILTIIGYSLNDTVVIFDRIREFLRKYKSKPFVDLIDFSLNSVLPRTLLTSVCTLIALVSLYIFGGEVIRGFTFAMIWGVFVGTYSSIFVAAPVLILLGSKRDWSFDPVKQAADARP
jgi:preprotein translocase SecF subunit